MNRLPFRFVVSVFALGLTLSVAAQQTVTFPAKDGLTVTADLYLVDLHKPYILLLHQAGYSRGEYREIAPRLTKLGYNCLAIDQRSGGEVNLVKNQTARLACEKGLGIEYIDAMQDVEAAIDYIKSKTDKPIVVWGSTYSASLALMIGAKNLRVQAVVAFSPGEYFGRNDFVKSQITNLSIPVMVMSNNAECGVVKELCSNVDQKYVMCHCSLADGLQGSKALWKDSPLSNDYWMNVMLFFSKLN